MPHVYVKRGKSDKAEVSGGELAFLLGVFSPVDLVCIELVGGMTGQSASSAFNFGRAAGAPEYIAAALGLRTHRVAPQTWKKAVQLRAGKDGAIATAASLWPDVRIHHSRKEFREGMAEAALIALYGYRMLQGEQSA